MFTFVLTLITKTHSWFTQQSSGYRMLDVDLYNASMYVSCILTMLKYVFNVLLQMVNK